jgi:hypothetical protein
VSAGSIAGPFGAVTVGPHERAAFVEWKNTATPEEYLAWQAGRWRQWWY